ncbi:tRNA-specific 2-thiouridylase MnmA [bacterium BMS3Abin02]|nr:tRNA-specific 2-thiouridylase MnmA [bacterium BMS3Abin02]GBE22442.1 tRNA-specific 2-thiouridylase MnmA [bacterium BMS3Bbin01]HDL50028.1 tRNA 2-thiouridine(34) synthase MnmA [Actinomycetota bacterium]
MRVLAAMSGGVDSSVAAALMVEEGHDVIGATLKLWEGPDGALPTRGCCTLSDSEDARRVAARIGIAYYVLDATEEFRAGIVDPFISDYLQGRTPNPCIECNRVVKFDHLLRWARDLDCDLVVTGHYARVVRDDGEFRLLRGTDRNKDQSYVVSMLGQEQLRMLRFPVGSRRKEEVREIAAALGLRTADKPDSQDICFVGDDYRTFLRREVPVAVRPGPILDEDGSVVGSHDGVVDFTIGQRKGLGVAFGEPRYVQEIRPSCATVVIGRRGAAPFTGMRLGHPSWVAGRPPAPGPTHVQIRAHGEPLPAILEDDARTVWFSEPRDGVAAGQTAALYEGEQVLGGGTITETLRE